MIKARCPRRLLHKPVIRVQLIEPETRLLYGKKAQQGCDRAGDLGIVSTVDEISSYPLRLCPKPCHSIMHAAIDEYRIDRDTPDRIDAMGIREGDEP